jgi:outer membrane protein insertion porin family
VAGRAEEDDVRRRAALRPIAPVVAALALLVGAGAWACGGASHPAAGPAPSGSASAGVAANAPDGGTRAPHDRQACLPTAPANDPETISSIRVEGNVRVVKHDICKALSVRAGQPYDAAKIAADLRSLWSMHDFDDVQARRDPFPTGSVVTFVVRERAIVSEVHIDGNIVFDFDTVRKLVPIRTGSAADPADVRDATAALTAFYVDQGYRSATIDYALEPTTVGHATAHFKITEGPKVTISALSFAGLHVTTDAELRPLLDTQSGTIDAPGGLYKEDVLQHDLLKVEAHFYDRGLLQASVDPPALTLSADGKSLAVTIPVNEGPVFKLDVIHILGDGLAADEKTLIKVFSLKTGDVFQRSAVLEGIAKLEAFQAAKKKPVTHAEPSTALHVDKATVDLTIHLAP